MAGLSLEALALEVERVDERGREGRQLRRGNIEADPRERDLSVGEAAEHPQA